VPLRKGPSPAPLRAAAPPPLEEHATARSSPPLTVERCPSPQGDARVAVEPRQHGLPGQGWEGAVKSRCGPPTRPLRRRCVDSMLAAGRAALGCRHRDFSDTRRDAPTSLPSCREAVGRIRWRSAGGSARRSQASGWRLPPCRHPRTFRLHPASPSPLTLTAVSQGCCTRTALLKRRR